MSNAIALFFNYNELKLFMELMSDPYYFTIGSSIPIFGYFFIGE